MIFISNALIKQKLSYSVSFKINLNKKIKLIIMEAIRCQGIKRSGQRCQYSGHRGFCGIHEHQRPRPPQVPLPLPPVVIPHIGEPSSLDGIKLRYEAIINNQKDFIDMLMLSKENISNALTYERSESHRVKLALEQVRKNLKEAHLFADELCFKLDLCKIKNVIDNTSKDEDCCICHDNLKNSVITQCCKNELCFDCLYKWGLMKIQDPTCPICRGSLYID